MVCYKDTVYTEIFQHVNVPLPQQQQPQHHHHQQQQNLGI
jgi:hypothetical protein